jgi:hypothetical protein
VSGNHVAGFAPGNVEEAAMPIVDTVEKTFAAVRKSSGSTVTRFAIDSLEDNDNDKSDPPSQNVKEEKTTKEISGEMNKWFTGMNRFTRPLSGTGTLNFKISEAIQHTAQSENIHTRHTMYSCTYHMISLDSFESYLRLILCAIRYAAPWNYGCNGFHGARPALFLGDFLSQIRGVVGQARHAIPSGRDLPAGLG